VGAGVGPVEFCPGRAAGVGEGTAGDLASGDAVAIGEGGDEEGVDTGLRLEDVEDLFRAFVEEGDGSDLNADGGDLFFGGLGGELLRGGLEGDMVVGG